MNAGKLPVYRALTQTDDERLIRKFVLQLKLGSVSAEYFAKKFRVDPRERFAEPLQRIRDWGFAEIDGHRINMNREGLLQVDRLLHEFSCRSTATHATPDAASLLKPLADFYTGRALPEVRFIEAARIPQAYRQLLNLRDKNEHRVEAGASR